jgi:putative oxidoreductase
MSNGPLGRYANWPGHSWLALAARLYLGIVFLAACYHKILHPDQFALDVATYQFLPLVLVNIFAITLPWVELGAGIQLVIGWRPRPAALLVALMMLAFMIALGWALHKGLDMSCGCFASGGANDDPISAATIWRDAGWLALALYVLLLDKNPLGLDRLLARNAKEAKK